MALATFIVPWDMLRSLLLGAVAVTAMTHAQETTVQYGQLIDVTQPGENGLRPRIHPNPAMDLIIVDAEPGRSVEIIDASGRVVAIMRTGRRALISHICNPDIISPERSVMKDTGSGNSRNFDREENLRLATSDSAATESDRQPVTQKKNRGANPVLRVKTG
jgi:hypothetical protein